MPEYRTRDGDVLDWICWKHYGATEDVVEAVLDANPHLADRGPVYAAGVIVTLPERAAEDATASAPAPWE